jgi:uncharacterized membrane protein YphA (DoxX/SURF4 family)
MKQGLEGFARWFLALVLMAAGASKIIATEVFRQTLEDTGFITASEAAILAVTLPGLEILLSLALVARILDPFVPAGTLALSLCFLSIHGYSAVAGTVKCGCLGLLLQSSDSDKIMLALSATMTILSALLIRGRVRPKDADITSSTAVCDARGSV